MDEQIITISMNQAAPEGYLEVNTTSRSTNWSRGLSPFFVPGGYLYHDRYGLDLYSKNVENAWQFSKVYPQHHDQFYGEPSAEWVKWADAGFRDIRAHRYPMGKGAVPLYSWWDGKQLDYIEARKRIYVPVYSRQVLHTQAWAQLVDLVHFGHAIALRDFDGYNYKAQGKTFDQVLNDPKKKMGHAHVLSAMLDGVI